MENLFEYNKDLTSYTTFGIPCKARIFAEYSSVKELTKISRTPEFTDNQVFHLGGGSNLLIFNTFDGLILHSAIRGIISYAKNESTEFVIAGAGEKWTDLVDWCVEHGLSGLECMAGIPGQVGAAPVQNVGAYGVEASDVIFNVECFDTETRELITLRNDECGFGYRDSNFKKEWKNRYIVTRVSFRLKKTDLAENLSYSSLKAFAESLDHPATISEIRDEVLRIRNEKLPTVDQLGSAGSFFKNPVIHKNFYEDEVLRRNPDVPCYKVDYRLVKIPAGWLIEHAGLKGYRIGDAEVYPGNCLVMVNRGNATSEDIKQLAKHVADTVNKKYGVRLFPEVNYIDTSIDVTVLGTGTSKGIPEIGCECKVCSSEDQHDKRLRSSVLVDTMGVRILIDASPDFRIQALNAEINHIDALLITHVHYDHVGGIDDLRPFCLMGNIPVYCRQDVDEDLRRRIDYCFSNDKYPGVPGFDTHVIGTQPFYIKGVKVVPIEVNHGNLPIVGFRIGDFGYITDCKTISDEEKEKLKGLDTLIINALRARDHFAHLTIVEAMRIIDELQPKRAYITHLCHEAGLHKDLCKTLPATVQPAYDFQKIHIE